MRLHSARNAFTLVELLVVIAIIGILVSLLLPAVQSAREAARRMQCGNNLKQLGLAVLQFEAVHGTFPTSFSYATGSGLPAAPADQHSGKGWILSLMPYLEQQALHDQFASNQGFIGPFGSNGGLQRTACRHLMKTPTAGLQCPSDASENRIDANQWQWVGIEVFVTSYKGVIGDNRMGGASSIHIGSEPDCHLTADCNGIFWRHTFRAPVMMAQVRDGASNTLMIGESRPRYFPASAAYFSNGDYASTSMPLNFVMQPFDRNQWWNYWGFSSDHAGGANFCMVDGSVHFLSDSIDHLLYRHLSTKAGGEVVSW